MRNSEKLKTFEANRDVFKPYGLTCERWKPDVMRKADRHNEIEINFFIEGGITYLFKAAKIEIPANSFTVFWGLVPHQIVEYTSCTPYYVCTIPLTQFLEWKLPAKFVDSILNGQVLIENSASQSSFDEFLLNNWVDDLSIREDHVATLLEMQARLYRMANRISHHRKTEKIKTRTRESTQVERLAMFIAQNYSNPIRIVDIGKEAGLHPDYANVIFKKTFGVSLSEYLIQERVSNAQRKLISTDKSVTDILYECGFNSISNFNAAFRKINKCTPREFRKKYL